MVICWLLHSHCDPSHYKGLQNEITLSLESFNRLHKNYYRVLYCNSEINEFCCSFQKRNLIDTVINLDFREKQHNHFSKLKMAIDAYKRFESFIYSDVDVFYIKELDHTLFSKNILFSSYGHEFPGCQQNKNDFYDRLMKTSVPTFNEDSWCLRAQWYFQKSLGIDFIPFPCSCFYFLRKSQEASRYIELIPSFAGKEYNETEFVLGDEYVTAAIIHTMKLPMEYVTWPCNIINNYVCPYFVHYYLFMS